MKRLCVPLVLMMLAVPSGGVFGLGQKVLAGVFEPETIKVAGGELLVVEKGSVLVYSLEDLRLIRKIGGQGEGPGEFKAADYWYNTVTVLPGEIFVDGLDKTARFSRDGRLLGESRKPLGINRMVPVGKNYAAVKPDHLERDVQYQCLLLYDANGTLVRELARQESPVQAMTHRTEMIPDVLNFAVWEDRIYVEKSREGFVIDVFDGSGSLQYRIEKRAEKIPITKTHESEALERFKTDPFVKRLGFEEFKKMSTLVWPEALPAIRDLEVAEDRIYVRTWGWRDRQEAWMVLDLEGMSLGRADLPRVDSAPLLAALNGVHYYAIHDHKLYMIRDNEKTDEWELFITDINIEAGRVK